MIVLCPNVFSLGFSGLEWGRGDFCIRSNIMEWILFFVVFLFILGFVMRDPTRKDSDARRENLSKADDHSSSSRLCDYSHNFDLVNDPLYSSLPGNIYHNSLDDH
jgi:hypothetical protein